MQRKKEKEKRPEEKRGKEEKEKKEKEANWRRYKNVVGENWRMHLKKVLNTARTTYLKQIYAINMSTVLP
jgi:hypothetical protein